MKRAGLILLALVAFIALGAPWLAPNPPAQSFPDALYAPPTRVHIAHDGDLRAPFIYRQAMVSRLERRFEEDRTEIVPLEWFARGRLVSVSEGTSAEDGRAEEGTVLLLLGADAFGRDT